MNTDYASVEYNNINKCIQNLSIFKNKLEFIECIYSTSKRAIYKVKDKENNKICIAKFIIKVNVSEESLYILDFIKNNKHGNINNIYEIGEINSFYVILCEYIVGKSLKQFIETNSCSKKFYHIFKQIINGLEFLHNNKILHADIKPSNIIINNNLDVKLIDFDSSIKMKNNKKKINLIIGTKPFIAPEIINKKTYYYKSDLWSLCASIMYCLDNSLQEDFNEFNLDFAIKKLGNNICELLYDMIKDINHRPNIKSVIKRLKK